MIETAVRVAVAVVVCRTSTMESISIFIRLEAYLAFLRLKRITK